MHRWDLGIRNETTAGVAFSRDANVSLPDYNTCAREYTYFRKNRENSRITLILPESAGVSPRLIFACFIADLFSATLHRSSTTEA